MIAQLLMAVALVHAHALLPDEAAPAGDEQLEQALFLEESGKRDEAAELYASIASQHASEPEVGGRALIRLANLYLRDKRRDQAAQTLRQVLREHGGHEKLARHAKEQLAKLSDVLGGAPQIAHTTPRIGAGDVPADLTAITVTFDQPMMDQSWSWTGSEHLPETTGEPSYDEFRMTCTLPVRLAPGTVYRVGINSASFLNFKNKYGAPAEPSVIVFATAAKDGSPTEIPAELLAETESTAPTAERSPSKRATPAQRREAARLAAQGWQNWSQQKFADAEQLFRKSLDMDASVANTWNGLGWSLFNQGIADDAEEAFKNGLERDPKQAACLNGLGWIARNRGDQDAAVAWWEKAVAALPEATASLGGLVTVALEKKDYDAALKWLEKWKKVEPTSEQVDQLIEQAKAGGEAADE